MPTAGVLMIGDELLSGRTRDANLSAIADYLVPFGIEVKEARIVSDDQDAIVDAVNALRAAYTYVFTTGGIGPTHDDITTDAIAAAFGVPVIECPDALEILEERYKASGAKGVVLTPERRRMARIPQGASLVVNPVSGAPGFQTGNVFTLAGVPSIARGMLEDVGHRLETGEVVHSVTLRTEGLREGDIAAELGGLAEEMNHLSFGSYPWYETGSYGVHLVIRGRDTAALETAAERLITMIKGHNLVPERH